MSHDIASSSHLVEEVSNMFIRHKFESIMPIKENLNLPILLITAAATGSLMTFWISHQVKKKRDRKSMQDRLERRRKEILNKSISQKASTEKAAPVGTLVTNLKIDEVYLWSIQSLSECFESEVSTDTINRMHGMRRASEKDRSLIETTMTNYNQLIQENECILADLVRTPNISESDLTVQRTVAYVRAGPREQLFFNPKTVNAAIVTCGGLCPGLNNVIREITNTLFYLYAIGGKVYGVRGGYKGFYDPALPPLELTPSVVENIHHSGGTILGSSRGGFDFDKILNFLRQYNIKQLYVIGGDGTHRGAYAIHEGCMKVGLNVAVAGIPKTIDNDVDYIDRSFGFESAVEAAQNAIRVAKTEAYCNLPNGIGIVKLMGRSAGFIAVHATLSSGDVDLCLVPEVPIVLEGSNGCLPHLYEVVKSKGFAVVVVAEGAGEELLGVSAETDASGNKKLPAIGEYMKKVTEKFFETKGEACTVKYIDPSYLIRSVPANSFDSLYCSQLAQNAVHGAMAGFTGFSVGLCNNKMVYLPIPQLVATSPCSMNPHGRTWERVLAQTGQPNTALPKKKK